MGKNSIAQSVTELVEPVVRAEGLDLVDIEYKKEGHNWYLRIYLDKQGGVNIDDCQKVSRRVEDMIEIDELVNSAYILEVSSPGLDRPLKKEKDFLRSLGKKIRVTTYSPINNQRNFVGTIKDFGNETLYLETVEAPVAIPIANIASAKYVLDF